MDEAGVAVWQAREAKRVSRHAAIFGNTVGSGALVLNQVDEADNGAA